MARHVRPDSLAENGAARDKLARRSRKLVRRSAEVVDPALPVSQLAEVSVVLGSAHDLTIICEQCSGYVEASLARVESMASMLHAHASRADADIRDRLVVQAMLGDLSVTTAQFRKLLSEFDQQTARALDSLRALARDVDQALERVQRATDQPVLPS